MFLCAGAFLKLFFVPHKVPRSPETCMVCGSRFEEYLVPSLFLSLANTYGMIGMVNYQATSSTQDDSFLDSVVDILPLVTSFLAVLLGLAILGAMPTSKLVTKRALFWVSLSSFFGLGLLSVVENLKLPLTDLHAVVSVGGLLVLWAVYLNKAIRERDARIHSIVKAASVMAYCFSFGYESIFYNKCDSLEAFRNCLRDCPLPTENNSHALINLVVVVATIGWTISENSEPSIQKPKVLEYIDPTVASLDDSASIDTIEDEFHDFTLGFGDADGPKLDIETGSSYNDNNSTTEVEHSSFDHKVIDTVSSEDPSSDNSVSKPTSGS